MPATKAKTPIKKAPAAKKPAPKVLKPAKAGKVTRSKSVAAVKKVATAKKAVAPKTGRTTLSDLIKGKPAAKVKKESTKAGFSFPVGNKFWQCRAKHGRNGIWATPNDLLTDCLAYFQWIEDNPLWEEKGFAFQGVVTKELFAKMRAATLDGLQLHLGISHTTWQSYRVKPDFVAVCEYADKAIRQQKFAGAAADLLNASIIARDLGLADRSEITGRDGGALQVVTSDMPDDVAAQLYREMLQG